MYGLSKNFKSLMNTETLLYILIAGIIALLLALFQYIYKSKKHTKVNMVLTLLRFLTLFFVFLLMINPKFENINYFNQKPNLVVAIDNSESVTFLGHHEKTRKLVSLLKENEALKERFNLEFFTFGKDVNALDTLRFNETQTNPTLLFDRFSQVYSNSVAPLIMITDGNQTYGNDYEFAARNYKQVIFPIILGDTTNYTDLKIEQLNVKYKRTTNDLFFLFHRPRKWNQQENVWMGYERKRGKLSDLNALLRGITKEHFSLIIGNQSVFPKIK